jgi:hypothetical protein
MQPTAALFAIFLPVLMVSVFAFVSIASWAEARKREREALYRSEVLKRIADSTAPGAASALDIIREEHRASARRRIEGQRLGGLINVAVGLGLMALLRGLEKQEPAYLVGLIPLLVGVALLIYPVLFPPKD